MKIQRSIEQEEGAITNIRRIRPLRIDEPTMKEKYQDMKTDILKKRFPLRRKLYHQQRVIPFKMNKLLPQSQPHQQNRYGK
jgi:hypothetical protein